MLLSVLPTATYTATDETNFAPFKVTVSAVGSDSDGYLFGQQATTISRRPASALIEIPEDGTYYVWGW